MKNKVDDFLYEDLSYKIRGCVFTVYNNLGFGHKENIYQKALALEFKNNLLNFTAEESLPIIYQNKKIGIYKPDFIIDKKIIIEIKSVPFMPKSYETQLTYYLKGTNYKLGFIINFGSQKLDMRRRIWSPHYQRKSVNQKATCGAFWLLRK
jgi:GxxExxY protein